MSRSLLLGASGHLGRALLASAPQGMQVTLGYHTHPLCNGVQFDATGAEPLPEADIVIGSFPFARLLQSLSGAEIEERVAAYVERCGGARLIVQLSTDAVYSGVEGLRGEADPLRPVTAYGRAQVAVDEALLRARIPALIIRTSFIFGWNGEAWDKRLAPFARREKALADQRWPNDVFRSPTEVNFLADGIWRAVSGGLTGVLNIAGPRLSIHDFFRTALKGLGISDIPPPISETNPDVARDTSMRADRLEAELKLQQGTMWTWYRNSLAHAQTV